MQTTTTILLAALIAIAAASEVSFTVDDCGRVPPALWCKNSQLQRVCGVEAECQGYRRSSRGKKIQLTLFYEGLCPDCEGFMTGPLFNDVYLKFGDLLDLELVPYGNAKRDANGTITCQHGDDECAVNRYESCAIHFMPEPFPFVVCLETLLKNGLTLEKSARKCYAKFHVVPHIYDQIIHCVNGPLGQKLQLAAATRTESAWPDQHQYVPWLVFNNVSMKESQLWLRDLPVALCDWYVPSSRRSSSLNNACGALKAKHGSITEPCYREWF